ncbi:MAG: hypothetical protein JNN07_01130 [Verrucomicrobiales bacterium]|nr:hypothetical protein [Verrucomicrobiales bacterium]
MNCPICNSKLPFGLQIHMAAAHGPNSVKHKLEASPGGDVAAPAGGKRRPGQRRQGRPFGRKSAKAPRRPRPF